ncbi:unnamed protein product [Rodentolepis nana]|uniref:Uncharacterized protein n=1 Tax=Rodentolepis nana TaxID=102285 RepID=A0A0R3TXB5_RODNA|nr:unnamed protein product [Rodentolepis nana]
MKDWIELEDNSVDEATARNVILTEILLVETERWTFETQRAPAVACFQGRSEGVLASGRRESGAVEVLIVRGKEPSNEESDVKNNRVADERSRLC